MTEFDEPLNLLLVEDNEDDALLLQKELGKLRRGEFRVTRAKTIREALERIAAEHFELVLLDLDLPDSRGLEGFYKIKERVSVTWIVIFSGSGDHELYAQAIEAGARDYLIKAADVRPIVYGIDRCRYQIRTASQGRQQAAIAKFAQGALLEPNTESLLNKVAALASEAFGVESALVLKSQGHDLPVVATGENWPAGERWNFLAVIHPIVQRARRSSKVVLIDEEAIDGGLHAMRVSGGAVVSVPSRGESQLALCVLTKVKREFRASELQFLRTVADLLGQALERQSAQAALLASEASLAAAQAIAHWGSWELDLDSNGEPVNGGLRWSDEMYRIAGFEPRSVAVTRELFYSIVPADEHESIKVAVGDAIRGALEYSIVHHIRRPNGELRVIQEMARVYCGPNGSAPVKLIGTAHDITEQRAAEQRIAEQAALLDNAQDAIFVTDLCDGIIYWNKGAERVFGFSKQDALGKTSTELLKTDRKRHAEAVSELIARGEWSGEVKTTGKTNGEVVLHTRWTLMRDAAGDPKSILAINTDITEKKKLEGQFLRAQRMESIGTLAGGIAHDLNNVLAPIMMCLDMLEGQFTSEEDRKLIATVQKSTQRGAELVRQVLSFARGLEGKRVALKPTHILREVQKIARETFPKNIQVNLSANAELACVLGDPTQLHQVLMNLCVNARDAMPGGGTLRITAENIVLDEVYSGFNPDARPGRYVMIAVTDSGTGIPPEIREKIFDPFFTTKEVGQGTGLGLSTTLGIVKSHGGFIQVTSEVGKGSTFSVYLPATKAPDDANTAVFKKPARLPQGSGQTILVVDDEESVRTVAKKTLERNGYKVLLASNGAEAVSLYATQRAEIAVVVTDMAMPIMDGTATVIALKSINPQVSVVGSSGLANNAALAKSLGSNLDAFIAKPYNAEILLSTLHGILAKQKPAAVATA